jgi:hypothetical protein
MALEMPQNGAASRTQLSILHWVVGGFCHAVTMAQHLFAYLRFFALDRGDNPGLI